MEWSKAIRAGVNVGFGVSVRVEFGVEASVRVGFGIEVKVGLGVVFWDQGRLPRRAGISREDSTDLLFSAARLWRREAGTSDSECVCCAALTGDLFSLSSPPLSLPPPLPPSSSPPSIPSPSPPKPRAGGQRSLPVLPPWRARQELSLPAAAELEALSDAKALEAVLSRLLVAGGGGGDGDGKDGGGASGEGGGQGYTKRRVVGLGLGLRLMRGLGLGLRLELELGLGLGWRLALGLGAYGDGGMGGGRRKVEKRGGLRGEG